jgi:tetratricopeptide (TPR) repeat protein
MIGQNVSHYRILSLLGAGGMGVVYAAEDLNLGRHVAIKFLSAVDEHQARARFLREARAASALNHQNIAAIYDYGETEAGQPYIVMELVQGQTLSDSMEAGALTLQRAIEIIIGVAEALACAHRHNIIHRDIKPSNVIVNEQGIVKVLDFGLAKQLTEETTATADPDAKTLIGMRTVSGTVVGTPLYLSPEQALGTPVDARSDLFSLGALLYECIAGRPAFTGASVFEIGAQVLHVNPPPPSRFNRHVPPALDRITLKALAKKREDRYQSADEMLADLRTVRDRLSSAATARTPRLTLISGAFRSSAFTTLSDKLHKPRFSFTAFIGALALAVLAIWAGQWLWRPALHKPLPEAARLYEMGTLALRDGAFHQAKVALEQAIRADSKFALAHARLAEALMELDQADLANDALVRVSALVPDRSALPEADRLYLEAVTAIAARDFPAAIEAYRKIAQLAPDQAQVYVDLGRAYEKAEEIDKAQENYLEATRRDPNYATAYLRLGALHVRQQNVPAAAQALTRAEELFQANGNLEGVTEVLYQRGILFGNTGRLPEAREQFQQAYDKARVNGYEAQQVIMFLNLGGLAYRVGDTAKAQQYAAEAIQFAQQRGLETFAIDGIIDLGLAFLGDGDYGKAETYFKQALDLSQRHRARLREAISLMNLGSLYIQQKQPDEGLPKVEQALAFFEQGNYRSRISICLSLIGRARRQKGDFEGALKVFQKKLDLAEQAGDRYQIAFSYGEMASVLAEQNLYPEAIDRYNESYAIYKSLNNRFNMLYAVMNRGSLLWQLGRYDEARASLAEALTLAQQLGSSVKPVLAEIPLIYAQMALSERRFPEAIARSSQSLSLAGTQYKDVAIGAKGTLGLARAFTGAAREGKRLCEEAVELARSTGDQTLFSRALLMLAEAALESGDAPAALAAAVQAQERCARAGQFEMQWRAWLIAARASERKGDQAGSQDQMTNAAATLSHLRQKWDNQAFQKYLTRPDIQSYVRQLGDKFTVDANSTTEQ